MAKRKSSVPAHQLGCFALQNLAVVKAGIADVTARSQDNAQAVSVALWVTARVIEAGELTRFAPPHISGHAALLSDG